MERKGRKEEIKMGKRTKQGKIKIKKKEKKWGKEKEGNGRRENATTYTGERN